MTFFDGVDAVIFDFDGVVCDSERLWCELLTEVYAGAAVVFPHRPARLPSKPHSTKPGPV